MLLLLLLVPELPQLMLLLLLLVPELPELMLSMSSLTAVSSQLEAVNSIVGNFLQHL